MLHPTGVPIRWVVLGATRAKATRRTRRNRRPQHGLKAHMFLCPNWLLQYTRKEPMEMTSNMQASRRPYVSRRNCKMTSVERHVHVKVWVPDALATRHVQPATLRKKKVFALGLQPRACKGFPVRGSSASVMRCLSMVWEMFFTTRGPCSIPLMLSLTILNKKPPNSS